MWTGTSSAPGGAAGGNHLHGMARVGQNICLRGQNAFNASHNRGRGIMKEDDVHNQTPRMGAETVTRRRNAHTARKYRVSRMAREGAMRVAAPDNDSSARQRAQASNQRQNPRRTH